MATRLEDEFDPTRINAPDAAYPAGSLKDETTPGVSDDGTPLASRVGNDWQGFSQSALDKAGIAANGQPDSVSNPQILQAIEQMYNDGDSQLAGGNIWPLSSQESAQNGDDLSGYEFVRLSGGDFSEITLFPIIKQDGTSTPISGALSNINLTVKPYSATVGTDDVWLLDIRYYIPTDDGVNVGAYWVEGDGTTDDTVAFQQSLTSTSLRDEWLNLGAKQIRTTAQVEFVFNKVRSYGAKVLKDHDGVGIRMIGGATYTRVYGELTVQGIGAGFGDGTSPSTNIEAVGIRIEGNRFDFRGSIRCENNQGHGLLILCESGNMNKCYGDLIECSRNNGYGIMMDGSFNNSSVWKLHTRTQFNWVGGVFLTPIFRGRQWEWYCYNESTQDPAAVAGVNLGSLRFSYVFIYSEEQSIAGPELLVGANCERLDIFDARGNTTTVDDAAQDIRIYNGALETVRGTNGRSFDRTLFANFTDNVANTAVREYTGASSLQLCQEVFYGNGKWEMQTRDRTNLNRFSSLGVEYNNTVFNNWASDGYGEISITGSRGTPDAPLQVQNSDNFSGISGYLNTTGTAFTQGFFQRGLARTVGGGNKAFVDIQWGVANNSSVAATALTLQFDGVLNCPGGYIPFTGSHIGISDTEIATGLAVDVIEVKKAVINLGDEENPVSFDQLTPIVSVSGEKSKVCAGIVDHCNPREGGGYDVYIAAVGDNSTRNLNGFLVCDEGGDIEAGDILCTSSTPGYLMKMPEGEAESVVRFKSLQKAIFIDGKCEIYGYFK